MPKMLEPRTGIKQLGVRISLAAFEKLGELKRLQGGSVTGQAERHLELLQRIEPEKYEAAVAAFLAAGR